MKYKFSPQSLTELEEIFDYISGDREGAAHSVVNAVIHACELLAEMPEMGRVIDQLRGHNIYMHTVGKYPQYIVFYYLPDDGTIEVLHVIDGRRDIPALMEKWRQDL